jgi:hypothetical protein
MKIFLAGENGLPFLKKNFYDFYRLDSYIYMKNRPYKINNFKDFILDSGIFTYLNGKTTKNIDWEKYVFEYSNFIIKHKIKNYIEVDIDKIVGLKEVENLRYKLEKKVGYKCMPVWHLNRGYDKWLEICNDYDYICFGAFITDGLSSKKYIGIKRFLTDAKKNNCKVHGLGFTNFKYLKHLKFYSVDSTSWVSGNRYGHICNFDGNKIINTKRKKGQRIKNTNLLAWHNFIEWVKFSNYAEKNI